MGSSMNGIFLAIALYLVSSGNIMTANAGPTYCSKSDEECAFPFVEDGKTYTDECVDGFMGDWCKTNGSYGWAYCELCPGGTNTDTTRTTQSTQTTKQPNTHTTKPSTAPTAATKISATTTIKAKPDDFKVKAIETTTSSRITDANTPPATVAEPMRTEKTSTRAVERQTKPKQVTTTEKEEMCTLSGESCQFPFSYSGETYADCAPSTFKSWGWCYTDVALGTYSDCIPCHLMVKTSTRRTTTRKEDAAREMITGKTARTTRAQENKQTSSPTTVQMESDRIKTTIESKEETFADVTGDKDDSGMGAVSIVILVLSALFVVVLLLVIYLYLMRRLRKSKNDDDSDEDKKTGGSSAEGLLGNNKTDNTTSNGSSQEMQPLNPSPDKNGGGDWVGINEKGPIAGNEGSATLTV